MKEIKKEFQPFYDLANELMQGPRRIMDIYKLTLTNGNKKIAFKYKENKKWQKIHYSEINDHVLTLAAVLNDKLKNVEKNTYVGLKLKNSPKWVFYLYALLMIGYKPLLININEDIDNTTHLISEAGANAVILETNEQIPNCLSIVDEYDYFTNKDVAVTQMWENKIAFATSGTTKEARIFVYTGNNLCEQIYAAYTIPFENEHFMYPNTVGQINILAMLPFSHIFGFVAVLLWYTFFASTIVFLPSLKPADIISTCQETKITHLYAVPLFWDTLVKSIVRSMEKKKKSELLNRLIAFHNGQITRWEAGFASRKFIQKIIQKQTLGTNIKLTISGGSKFSKKTQEILWAIGYPVHNGYGMTEIGITSVALNSSYDNLIDLNVGRPLYNVEYKMDKGELLVKSMQMHSYALMGGEERPPLVDDEGYFHTEDMAYIKDDGALTLLGKKDNVYISSNGENVYLEELDSHFANISGVDELSSFIHNDLLSLVLKVANRNSGNVKRIEKEVVIMNTKLPTFKQVKNIYFTNQPLPKNASLKIKKYEIGALLTSNPEYFVRISSYETITFNEFDPNEVEKIKNYLTSLFADVLNIEKNKIGSGMHFFIDLGGDSFSYMNLFAIIQADYPDVLDDKEIAKLNTVDEFAYYLLSHKKG